MKRPSAADRECRHVTLEMSEGCAWFTNVASYPVKVTVELKDRTAEFSLPAMERAAANRAATAPRAKTCDEARRKAARLSEALKRKRKDYNPFEETNFKYEDELKAMHERNREAIAAVRELCEKSAASTKETGSSGYRESHNRNTDETLQVYWQKLTDGCIADRGQVVEYSVTADK